MKLLSRATRPADLEQCLAIVLDRFLYDAAALRALRAMWLDLMLSDVCRSGVVFASGQPQRVLACGFAAPVERSLLEAVRDGREPCIARRSLEQWRAGHSPFLDEALCAVANATDGLHLLGFSVGQATNVLDPANPEVALRTFMAVIESLVAQHLGLNIAAFASEVFGWLPELAASADMNLRREYSAHTDLLAGIPPERHPFVVSKTRAEAERRPAHILAPIFLNFQAPRFELNALERRLLRFALEGEADAALAEILAVSPSTLKKRWLHIYETMESALPEHAGAYAGQRGTELRRHVLRYVRQHPEELHAHLDPARANVSETSSSRRSVTVRRVASLSATDDHY